MSREKAQVVVQEALREDALVRAQEDPMAWVWIAFFTVDVLYTVTLFGLTLLVAHVLACQDGRGGRVRTHALLLERKRLDHQIVFGRESFKYFVAKMRIDRFCARAALTSQHVDVVAVIIDQIRVDVALAILHAQYFVTAALSDLVIGENGHDKSLLEF